MFDRPVLAPSRVITNFAEQPSGAADLTTAIAASGKATPRIFRMFLTFSTAVDFTVLNTTGGQTVFTAYQVTQIPLANVLATLDCEIIKGLSGDGLKFHVSAACHVAGFYEYNLIDDTNVGSGGNPNRFEN